MKKAFLVKASVMTRVVIDVENEETPTNWDIHNIIKSAHDRLINNLNNDYVDCIDDIFEDTECPYDAEYDKEWDKKKIGVI